MQSGFTYHPEKKFPTLPRAPIVEAVLQWQAAGTKQVSESELSQILEDSFPEYEMIPQNSFQAALGESSEDMGFQRESTRQGFRLTKLADAQPEFVCQFNRDGVIFSRLAPYGDWSQFMPEGLRFWHKFDEIFDPQSVARLSVRYISQMAVKSLVDVAEIIDVATEPLKCLGVSSDSFYHQDTVKAGDLPYTIHVRRNVQPSHSNQTEGRSLIVDIDVVTSDGAIEKQELDQKLIELRYLKNVVFFGLMKNAEELFGEKQI